MMTTSPDDDAVLPPAMIAIFMRRSPKHSDSRADRDKGNEQMSSRKKIRTHSFRNSLLKVAKMKFMA